jgi:hypothetical protein
VRFAASAAMDGHVVSEPADGSVAAATVEDTAGRSISHQIVDDFLDANVEEEDSSVAYLDNKMQL